MAVMDQVVLKSGRRVAVHHLAEQPGARTVVMCHAAPGAGNFDPQPAATAAREVTLIAVDRPGYGGSDGLGPDEWATVARAADDLAEVLDGRGEGPVGVAGWSAGGRVALALAARRPDLVDRVVVLATPAPNEEVPWIPEEQAAGLEALRGLPPEEVHAALAEQFAPIIPSDPRSEDALELVGGSPADAGALADPGARERLGEMLAAAFAQGPGGMVAEVAGYTLQPWGFEPEAVGAKTLLLYGGSDPIGSRHANWWLKRLPQARVEMTPGAGHLLVIPMWGRALSHLAPDTER